MLSRCFQKTERGDLIAIRAMKIQCSGNMFKPKQSKKPGYLHGPGITTHKPDLYSLVTGEQKKYQRGEMLHSFTISPFSLFPSLLLPISPIYFILIFCLPLLDLSSFFLSLPNQTIIMGLGVQRATLNILGCPHEGYCPLGSFPVHIQNICVCVRVCWRNEMEYPNLTN